MTEENRAVEYVFKGSRDLQRKLVIGVMQNKIHMTHTRKKTKDLEAYYLPEYGIVIEGKRKEDNGYTYTVTGLQEDLMRSAEEGLLADWAVRAGGY